MEEMNTKLNKELSDIQIAILSNLSHKGDTFTEQEIYNKLKENITSKDIDIAKIKKELNDLDQHNYITEVLNTTPKHNNNKIYQITSLGEEYIEKHTKSNNNQDE